MSALASKREFDLYEMRLEFDPGEIYDPYPPETILNISALAEVSAFRDAVDDLLGETVKDVSEGVVYWTGKLRYVSYRICLEGKGYLYVDTHYYSDEKVLGLKAIAVEFDRGWMEADWLLATRWRG